MHDTSGLYCTDTLAEAIGVPAERICLWISQGLIEPTEVVAGTYYFDFKQMSAAQTLRELVDSGTSIKKLRGGMKRLKKWLPSARPSERIVPSEIGMHVRLDAGELSEMDGQLRLEFADDSAPVAMPTSPRTAQGWFDRGADHYAAGELDAAIEAYRRALQIGGLDAKVVFTLAHALAEAGRNEQAAERYLQAIELDPQNADAWNNLGIVLCALDQHEDACRAFRQALEIMPGDPRARYNLADTLDELGQAIAAVPHWRAYLQTDLNSIRAAHARRRLAAL